MSPISDSELYRTIVRVDSGASVGEVVRLLQNEAAGEAESMYYIVVSLSERSFAVLTVEELNGLFETEGEDALDQTLRDIAGLLVPSRSVEQNEVELEEARFLRELSPGEILVVLRSGIPRGLFISRDKAAVSLQPLQLLDLVRDMTSVGGESRSAERQPVTEQRRVQAQIRQEENPRNTFLAGADNIVRCWIGLPEPQRGAVADTVIPQFDLPPEGLTLDAVLHWKGQTDNGTLHLPGHRTARSSDCDLHLHIPENERFVSAEIAFLYRGRAFEVVQVEAFVLPPGAIAQPHHTVEVKVQVAGREVVELADSHKVDGVMIYGEDRTRIDSPDLRGPTTLRTYSNVGGASFNLKDPDEIIDYLNTELFAAETSLVRRRARQGQTDEVLDTSDRDVLRILGMLAKHGAALYNSLGNDFVESRASHPAQK